MPLQELDAPLGPHGRILNHIQERFRENVMGAGRAEEKPAGLQDPECQLMQFAIPLFRCGHGFPVLRERGWVEDDDVKQIAPFCETGQCGEHVRFFEADSGECVVCGICLRPCDRLTGAVDPQDRRRPCMSGMKRESTVVAEAVQYPRSPAECADGMTIHALIQIVAGLLAGKQVHSEFESPVRDRDDPGCAANHPFPQRKLVEDAEGSLIALDDGHRMEEFLQDIADHGHAGVHTEGERLQNEMVVEPINDEAGQEIRFAMDQPIDRAAGEELCAKGEGFFEPCAEECCIDLDGEA